MLIPWSSLAFMALPLVGLGFIMSRWGFSIKPLGIASLRMVLQLLAVGYVLVFLFEAPNPWVSGAVFGVIVASSMNALSLFAERLVSELENHPFEVARNKAFNASLTLN